MNTKQIELDRELIKKLGGSTVLAKKLGFTNGKQRVHNWISRGIPSYIKLSYPKIFLQKNKNV